MSRLLKIIVPIAIVAAGTHVFGQSAVPFKLGTFEIGGAPPGLARTRRLRTQLRQQQE